MQPTPSRHPRTLRRRLKSLVLVLAICPATLSLQGCQLLAVLGPIFQSVAPIFSAVSSIAGAFSGGGAPATSAPAASPFTAAASVPAAPAAANPRVAPANAPAVQAPVTRPVARPTVTAPGVQAVAQNALSQDLPTVA